MHKILQLLVPGEHRKVIPCDFGWSLTTGEAAWYILVVYVSLILSVSLSDQPVTFENVDVEV